MGFLGETVRKARKHSLMSLQDVADDAGLTKAHVHAIENGRAINPTVKTLWGLSAALNIDPLTLAGVAFADAGGGKRLKHYVRAAALARAEEG